MAEGVVHVFHRVDVDEDGRDEMTLASRTDECHADAVVENRPAGQTREVVVHELTGQIGALAGRDFAAEGDEPGDLAAHPAPRHDRQRHGHRLAVGTQDRELATPAPVPHEDGTDLVVITGEHVRREDVRGREVGLGADPEAFARRLVEVQHPAVLVDDADQVRRVLDEREQLVDDLGLEPVGHGRQP